MEIKTTFVFLNTYILFRHHKKSVIFDQALSFGRETHGKPEEDSGFLVELSHTASGDTAIIENPWTHRFFIFKINILMINLL